MTELFSPDMAAAMRSVRRRIDDNVLAANRRIATLTDTEWDEVKSGLREHPDVVRAREEVAAYEARGRELGASVKALADSIRAFSSGIKQGLLTGLLTGGEPK